MPSAAKRSIVPTTSARLLEVPERVRPDRDAAGGVDRRDRLGDGRRACGGGSRARRGSGRPRAAARSSRGPRRAGARRWRDASNAACARCGRPTGALAAVGHVELAAQLSRSASAIRCARARAVGAEALERGEERGVVVVDAVAEDVEVLALAVDRRELGRRHDARCPSRRRRRRAPRRRRRPCRGRSARAAPRPPRRPRRPPRPAASAPSRAVECDCRSKVGRSGHRRRG